MLARGGHPQPPEIDSAVAAPVASQTAVAYASASTSRRFYQQADGRGCRLADHHGGSFAHRRGFVVSTEGTGTRSTGGIRCDEPRA